MAAKFWMVVGRGTPTKRHESYQSARTEAERLAKLDRGQPFTVLESMVTAKVTDVVWEQHQDLEQDQPF